MTAPWTLGDQLREAFTMAAGMTRLNADEAGADFLSAADAQAIAAEAVNAVRRHLPDVDLAAPFDLYSEADS